MHPCNRILFIAKKNAIILGSHKYGKNMEKTKMHISKRKKKSQPENATYCIIRVI